MRIDGLKPVLTPEQIDKRVRELAVEIEQQYAGKNLVMVCVLKGAFLFFADLVRCLHNRPQIDFLRAMSYGDGTNPQELQCTKDVELSVAGKHVLLVEDIIDTGQTVSLLKQRMLGKGAASVRVVALLEKAARRKTLVSVDFSGFAIPDSFVVGYGLDYAEQYRELPGIFEAVPE